MLIEKDSIDNTFNPGDRVCLEDFRGSGVKFHMFSWMIECIGKTGVVESATQSGMLKFTCCKVNIHERLSVVWPVDFCKLVERAPEQEIPDDGYELCNLVSENLDGSVTRTPLKGTDCWDNPNTDPLQDMLDAVEHLRGEAMKKLGVQLTESDGTPVDMTGWYPLNSERAEDGTDGMNCKYVMCEECPLRQQKDGDCQYERNWIHSWSGGERGRGDAIFKKLPPAWTPEKRKYQTEHLRSMAKYKVVKKGRSVGTSYTPMRYQEGDWVYLHNAKDTKIPEGAVLQVLKVHDNGNLEVYHDGFSLNGHPSRFRPATKDEEKAAILKKSEDLAESYEKVREADRAIGFRYDGLAGFYRRNEKEEPDEAACISCDGLLPIELANKVFHGEVPCPLCSYDRSKCSCGGTIYMGWDSQEGKLREKCMRCGEWRQP